MNTYLPRFLTACALMATVAIANAQTKIFQNTLQAPPADIAVDGSLKDWGDSLRYYNQDKHINYTLANDKDNIYMAIRINDYDEQVMVLNAGLTLGVDTHGGKKERFSITFPVGEQGGMTGFGTPKKGLMDSVKQEHDDLVDAQLTKLRNIK